MNMTAVEYGDSTVVMDCGTAFPGEEMPGIDLVIPDVSYLKASIENVRGFVITHGHEEHIGAIPYVLREVPVSVTDADLPYTVADVAGHPAKKSGSHKSY
jgi:ribonuclease J